MAKVQKKGLVRIFNAYKYSMKGFKAGLENEAAIRQEFVLAIILTIVACVFFNNDVVKLILLIAMPWLTVVAELLNSAVEAVVDRIGTEYHELLRLCCCVRNVNFNLSYLDPNCLNKIWYLKLTNIKQIANLRSHKKSKNSD